MFNFDRDSFKTLLEQCKTREIQISFGKKNIRQEVSGNKKRTDEVRLQKET
eukprot:Pgem_evm1s6776